MGFKGSFKGKHVHIQDTWLQFSEAGVGFARPGGPGSASSIVSPVLALFLIPMHPVIRVCFKQALSVSV